MYSITLQIYADCAWQDAMTLSFAQPEQGFVGPCSIAYESSYIRANLDASPWPVAGWTTGTC